MKKNLLIVIGGTDASGKDTQSRRLCENIAKENIPFERGSFPRYHKEFGRMIGGPFLGKPEICESYFERPSVLDSKAASMIYCAERRFELPWINESLKKGHLILDRYTESNMGMQGGKLETIEERKNLWNELDSLEHGFAELPRPDATIFLYMPYQVGIELKSRMDEMKDAVEKDKEYLKNAESSYLQLAEFYNWHKINCTKDGTIETLKSKDEIEKEVWDFIKPLL